MRFWVNRPKTCYDLVECDLCPTTWHLRPTHLHDATRRGEPGQVGQATGVKYSTVLGILESRIYLGEVQMNSEWFPGQHEAIITPEAFAAAHRGRVKGRARGADLLLGRVR